MVCFERLLLTQKSLWFTYESQGACRQWGMLLSVGALFGLRWTHSSFSEGKNAFLDRQAGWTWLWCLGADALFFFAGKYDHSCGLWKAAQSNTLVLLFACFSVVLTLSPSPQKPTSMQNGCRRPPLALGKTCGSFGLSYYGGIGHLGFLTSKRACLPLHISISLKGHYFSCITLAFEVPCIWLCKKGPKRDLINWTIGNSLSWIYPLTQTHRQSVCSFKMVFNRKRLRICCGSRKSDVSSTELTSIYVLTWTLRFNSMLDFQLQGLYWIAKD